MTQTLTHSETNKGQFSLERATIAFGLIGIAVVHIMDLPDKWEEVRYLGIAYVGLIIAATVLAERIIKFGSRLDLLASFGLAASVILGFVINRTVGMPNAMGDIGNWWEPLGLVSLFIEGLVVYQTGKLLLNSSK